MLVQLARDDGQLKHIKVSRQLLWGNKAYVYFLLVSDQSLKLVRNHLFSPLTDDSPQFICPYETTPLIQHCTSDIT